MKVTIDIDLRKADPLGLDLPHAFQTMRDCYCSARDMGNPDRTLLHYGEHELKRDRLLSEARRLHGLLLIVSKLVGPVAAMKMQETRWAINHDFHGVMRAEPSGMHSIPVTVKQL